MGFITSLHDQRNPFWMLQKLCDQFIKRFIDSINRFQIKRTKRINPCLIMFGIVGIKYMHEFYASLPWRNALIQYAYETLIIKTIAQSTALHAYEVLRMWGKQVATSNMLPMQVSNATISILFPCKIFSCT